MIKLIVRIFLAIACIGLLFQFQVFLSAEEVTEEEENYKILIISSYDPDFPTAEDMMDGVKSVFNQKRTELDFEFMDTKELHANEDLEYLAGYFHYKLTRKPDYDLVMAFDDKALHFVTTYQETLFKDLPIVFAGVNDREFGLEASMNPLITGVMEDISIEETIDVIETLQPYAVKLVLIVDNTISGQADLKRFDDVESQMDIEVINMSELKEEEFIQTIRDIPPEDAILPLSLYIGYNDRSYPFKESSSMLVENAQAPIYHLWKFGVGSGYVGGMVSSHFNQAELASTVAISILKGENPATMKLITESPNQYYFDYKVLLEHGLDPNKLPEDTKFINKPIPLKESDPGLYWKVVLLLFVFTMIIFILFLIIQYRVRKTKNIYKMNLFMKKVLTALQIPISIRDDKKKYVLINDSYASFLEQTPKYIVGKRVEELYDGETLINLKEMDDKVLSKGQDEREVYISRDGKDYAFRVKKRTFKDVDNKVYILSTCEDISKFKEYEKGLEEMVREKTESLEEAHAKLEKIAVVDQLTGFYNQRKLEGIVQYEHDRFIRYGKVYSLILLDVDYFKEINNTLGHSIGDDILKELALLFKENVRKVDVLGRWGSEEFMIICPETDKRAVKKLAEKLRTLVEKEVNADQFSITCSFGCITVDRLQALEDIFNQVNRALYDAKNEGHNQVKVANEVE